MTDQGSDDAQRRDAILLRLLKTPPQPRPKRERGKRASDKAGKESSPRRGGKQQTKVP